MSSKPKLPDFDRELAADVILERGHVMPSIRKNPDFRVDLLEELKNVPAPVGDSLLCFLPHVENDDDDFKTALSDLHIQGIITSTANNMKDSPEYRISKIRVNTNIGLIIGMGAYAFDNSVLASAKDVWKHGRYCEIGDLVRTSGAFHDVFTTSFGNSYAWITPKYITARWDRAAQPFEKDSLGIGMDRNQMYMKYTGPTIINVKKEIVQ